MAKSSRKQKYYVVWAGFNPGIYETWEECQKQVVGFDRAKYKSFKTKEEAEDAYDQSYETVIEMKGKKDLFTMNTASKPIFKSVAVDAACKGNPGILEYRGVFTASGTPIFNRGPYEMGTVNIGEFLAIVLALAWLKKEKLDYPIYSDSNTAISWIKRKRVNTKLQWSEKNLELYHAVQKAQHWLKNNSFSNLIIKWKTKEWGEIPADYGRK